MGSVIDVPWGSVRQYLSARAKRMKPFQALSLGHGSSHAVFSEKYPVVQKSSGVSVGCERFCRLSNRYQHKRQ